VPHTLRQPNKTYSSPVAELGKLFPSVLGCSIHEHSFASQCFVEFDSTVAATLLSGIDDHAVSAVSLEVLRG